MKGNRWKAEGGDKIGGTRAANNELNGEGSFGEWV